MPILIVGAGLSGCAYSWDNDVSGVALAELDMGGAAPTSISLAGPDQVVISQGDTFDITLDGNAEAGKALRFDRDGTSLTIARDTGIWDGNDKAIVRITIPAPKALSIAGSGEITSQTLDKDADLEIAGSGDIEIAEVDAHTLTIEIAGSGDIKAAGKTKRLEIEIAGSGDVALAELSADDVTVEMAGAGDVSFASDGTVKAEIVGSGDVVVVGDAKCSVDTVGSGSLTCNPRPKTAKTKNTKEAEAE